MKYASIFAPPLEERAVFNPNGGMGERLKPPVC